MMVKYICFAIVLSIIGQSAFGQEVKKNEKRWIEDRQMNFKIYIPDDYQANELMDGTDKIHAFVSPDQNMVIRVRAIKLNQNISDVQLQSIFEQNIINGAVRIMDEASDINGLAARWTGYTWVYNNVNTILMNYYIVRPDYAYVVWSICAENMVDQKTMEMSNIMGSFSLINGHPQTNNTAQYSIQDPSNIGTDYASPYDNNQSQSNLSGTTTNNQIVSNSYDGIQITSIQVGSEISSAGTIQNPSNVISSNSLKLHMVSDYTGNTQGQQFQVKWFSKTHNCLVVEASYLPTVNGQNRIHSFIGNEEKTWPLGDYLAEVWFEGHKLAETNFSVGNQQIEMISTNGKILGKCYADGNGNNKTKSLGGKYYSLDLNSVSDNDIFEVRVTSGTLKFVHIHYRNSSGVWYTAYHGMNTKFRVGDILNGKRRQYTHLTINVNAEHEKYLPVACYAEVWLNTSGQAMPVAKQQQPINIEGANLAGFWPHSARLTSAASSKSNALTPIPGFLKFNQYGEFSFEVPENWKKGYESGRTYWSDPSPDGGMITHIKLSSNTIFEDLIKTKSTNFSKNMGFKTISGFESFISQSKTVVGMQSNITLRTDVVYIKTSRGVHIITFQAREQLFKNLEPYAVSLLNSLAKYQ